MTSGTLSLILYFGLLVFAVGYVIYLLVKVNEQTFDQNRLNSLIEIGKFLFISIAIVIIGSVIKDSFSEREEDINEIKVFAEQVEKIYKAKNIEETFLITQFFATVSPSGFLRDSWKAYYDTIKPKYDKYVITENKKNEILVNGNINSKEVMKTFDSLSVAQNKYNQSFSSGTVDENYLIIISTDKNLEEAQFEVKKANESNYSTRLYKKSDRFFTCIGPYASKDEAIVNLSKIRQSLKSDAQLIKESSLCSNYVIEENYYECK